MLHNFYKVMLCAWLVGGSSASAEQLQADKLLATINASLDVIYAEGTSGVSDQEKQSQVRQKVEANYDLDVIIRRAIGRNWQLMDDGERTQVLELVKQLVLKAYVNGLKGKTRPEVTLGKLVVITDKRMEIESTVVLDGKTYYVLYRLGRVSSGWQIYDIVAENVSVVSNYREQLDDHFRRGNAAELIARLQEILEKEDIDEDTKI